MDTQIAQTPWPVKDELRTDSVCYTVQGLGVTLQSVKYGALSTAQCASVECVPPSSQLRMRSVVGDPLICQHTFWSLTSLSVAWYP
jgi:hypothetical protein